MKIPPVLPDILHYKLSFEPKGTWWWWCVTGWADGWTHFFFSFFSGAGEQLLMTGWEGGGMGVCGSECC